MIKDSRAPYIMIRSEILCGNLLWNILFISSLFFDEYLVNVCFVQAVEQLNIKTKSYKDLLTDEPFTRQDLITLQVRHMEWSYGTFVRWYVCCDGCEISVLWSVRLNVQTVYVRCIDYFCRHRDRRSGRWSVQGVSWLTAGQTRMLRVQQDHLILLTWLTDDNLRKSCHDQKSR